MASSSIDETIKLWDPATGAPRQTLEGHSGWVMAVAFSPDGKLLASGSWDKTVKLWDPATGTLQQTLKGYSDAVQKVAFSPGGKYLETNQKRFNTESFHVRSLTQTANSFYKKVTDWVRAVVFSPDGKYLETDQGRFNTEFLHVRSPSQTASSLNKNILVKKEWLTRNDSNAIWLPVEYRASSSAVYDSMLVMGHASGRVTFLKLV